MGWELCRRGEGNRGAKDVEYEYLFLLCMRICYGNVALMIVYTPDECRKVMP